MIDFFLKAHKTKKKEVKKEKKNKKQRDDAPPYELSRYVPQLKFIGQVRNFRLKSIDNLIHVN